MEVYQNSKGNAWNEAGRKKSLMTAWKTSGKFGYEPMRHIPALWKHASHDIVFTLVVDGFGLRCTNRQDEEHLRNSLQIFHPMTTDCTGSTKSGLTLNWDYIKKTFDISMPNYVPAALQKFQHKAPDKP